MKHKLGIMSLRNHLYIVFCPQTSLSASCCCVILCSASSLYNISGSLYSRFIITPFSANPHPTSQFSVRNNNNNYLLLQFLFKMSIRSFINPNASLSVITHTSSVLHFQLLFVLPLMNTLLQLTPLIACQCLLVSLSAACPVLSHITDWLCVVSS